MVYNIDTIPAKIYFKIHETGDLKPLTDEKGKTEEELISVWTEIVQKDEEYSDNKKSKKAFDLSKKIQELSSKYNSITNALKCLLFGEDEELLNLLSDYRYPITTENYIEDIKRTQNNVEIIHNKIEKFKTELEALYPEKEEGINKGTFEDALLGYYAILELAFKSANEITLLEFRGLEKQVKAKLKALEQTKINNGR